MDGWMAHAFAARGHHHLSVVVLRFEPNAELDAWAEKGWIDLRPTNMKKWLHRLSQMVDSRLELRDVGSAAASIRSYLPTTFEIGEVVAWIFNNEMGGYRVK